MPVKNDDKNEKESVKEIASLPGTKIEAIFSPNGVSKLTHSQKEYMVGIPENASANIQPWDPNAAKFAEGLIEKLEHATRLEIFWGGSLALGILGQNDIDLTLFSEPKDFEKYLQGVVSILGEPKYKLTDKILWRTTKDGHKVDAYLGSKNSEGVQSDIFFSNSLKNNPALLQEYISLKKEMGLSAREYYKRKNEFYNKVLTLQHPPLKTGI